MNRYTIMFFDDINTWKVERLTTNELMKTETSFLGARTDIALVHTGTSPWMNRFPILDRTIENGEVTGYVIVPSNIPCMYDNLKASDGRFVIYAIKWDASGNAYICDMLEDDVQYVSDNIHSVRSAEAVLRSKQELARKEAEAVKKKKSSFSEMFSEVFGRVSKMTSGEMEVFLKSLMADNTDEEK